MGELIVTYDGDWTITQAVGLSSVALSFAKGYFIVELYSARNYEACIIFYRSYRYIIVIVEKCQQRMASAIFFSFIVAKGFNK